MLTNLKWYLSNCVVFELLLLNNLHELQAVLCYQRTSLLLCLDFAVDQQYTGRIISGQRNTRVLVVEELTVSWSGDPHSRSARVRKSRPLDMILLTFAVPRKESQLRKPMLILCSRSRKTLLAKGKIKRLCSRTRPVSNLSWCSRSL